MLLHTENPPRTGVEAVPPCFEAGLCMQFALGFALRQARTKPHIRRDSMTTGTGNLLTALARELRLGPQWRAPQPQDEQQPATPRRRQQSPWCDPLLHQSPAPPPLRSFFTSTSTTLSRRTSERRGSRSSGAMNNRGSRRFSGTGYGPPSRAHDRRATARRGHEFSRQ
jgi:hypothetical protein